MYGPCKSHMDRKQSASLSNIKPSQDDLESIKLRPIFFSFPPPRNGHSPPRLSFHVPQYDYSSRVQEESSPFPSESTKPEKSYDPKPDREQCSVCSAISNCTNYFIGIGVLGLPYAFRCTGWLGLPVLIMQGVLMSYTGRLLGRCQREHSLWTYPDIAETAYGEMGRRLVSMVFATMLLFVTTLAYEISVASMQSLLPNINQIPFSMVVLYILLGNTFTNTRRLSWLSASGTLSTISLCLALIASYSLEINRNWRGGGKVGLIPVQQLLRQTELWRGPVALASGFGVFAFSFKGHAVFPSVYWSMKRPSKFPLVVHVTFAISTLCYILIGSLGYLAYGTEMHNHVQGTPGEGERILHKCITVLIAMTCTTKFTLASYPLTKRLIDSVLMSEYFKKRLILNEPIQTGGPPILLESTTRPQFPQFSSTFSSGNITPDREGMYTLSKKSLTANQLFFQDRLSPKGILNYSTIYDSTNNLNNTNNINNINDVNNTNDVNDINENYDNHISNINNNNNNNNNTNNNNTVNSAYNGNENDIDHEQKSEHPSIPPGDENLPQNSAHFEALEVLISTGLIGTVPTSRVTSLTLSKDYINIIDVTQQSEEVKEILTTQKKQYPHLILTVKFILRGAMPLIALGVSYILPDYIKLMCMIGAVFGLLISFIIPLLCYRRIFRREINLLENLLLLCLITGGVVLSVTAVIFVFFVEYEDISLKSHHVYTR